MEGFAVGKSGSIVRIADAGVNGWDPDDLTGGTTDTKSLTEVWPR